MSASLGISTSQQHPKPLAKLAWLLALCMLMSAALAHWFTPRTKVADLNPPINLETLVPAQFGDWSQDTNLPLVLADPNQTAALQKIYNQVLTRTYVNQQGYKIMLSLAYGGDQSDLMEMHKPEICYPAQGFHLLQKQRLNLTIFEKTIPVTRINTQMGQRVEPVTYWTLLGDTVVRGGFNKKIAQIKYGLVGQIPDGILVRFSSIDQNTENAYNQQQQFATQLISALPTADRRKLIGALP